ncbi:MAG: hypothetical protein EBU46_02470 [Nitrosomonadaceae bacterium]|nr:hypothetical protein [Nitrosomonadaceae bacterium]
MILLLLIRQQSYQNWLILMANFICIVFSAGRNYKRYLYDFIRTIRLIPGARSRAKGSDNRNTNR